MSVRIDCYNSVVPQAEGVEPEPLFPVAQRAPLSHTGRNRSRAGRRRHGGARPRRALGDAGTTHGYPKCRVDIRSVTPNSRPYKADNGLNDHLNVMFTHHGVRVGVSQVNPHRVRQCDIRKGQWPPRYLCQGIDGKVTLAQPRAGRVR